MKKIELISQGKFAITDKELPGILNENDVLLKIEYVGVCGSDIHYYSTGKIGDQIIEYPFVIGHECSATVVETGRNVTRVKKNNFICVEPLYSCGKCEQCLKGRQHTCLNQKFMGCPGQMDGGLSEYIVLPKQMCIPFPKSMTHQQAVIVEPLSIALYAIKFLDEVTDKSIAIMGFGPIGIAVFLSLHYQGCKSIVVSEKIKERIAVAVKLNADDVFDATDVEYEKRLRDNYPSKFDVVIDCCGEQSAIDTAQNIIKPGGKLLMIGIPETDEIKLNPHVLRRNEVSIQTVRRQNNCIGEAISMISDGSINVDFMITHTFHYTDTDQAFQIVSKYSDGVIKALIKI
jgi:L-iditol 2-dehydrogenase